MRDQPDIANMVNTYALHGRHSDFKKAAEAIEWLHESTSAVTALCNA